MHSGFDIPRSPRKGGVALGAPHLITPVNLENTGMALWARFGVFVQESCGCHVIRITGVFFAYVLDDVAFGTRLHLTETTFPIFR
jgi:hypothetical protein